MLNMLLSKSGRRKAKRNNWSEKRDEPLVGSFLSQISHRTRLIYRLIGQRMFYVLLAVQVLRLGNWTPKSDWKISLEMKTNQKLNHMRNILTSILDRPSITLRSKNLSTHQLHLKMFSLLYILQPSSASTFDSASDGSSPYMSASFRKRGPKLDK